MTDFLNNELSVGDNVVALSHKRTSSNLYLGEVVKLTDKMVVIKTINDVTRVSPYKVVKINKQEKD